MMACGKQLLFALGFALLVISFDVSSRQCGVYAADMFTFTVSNNVRDPKFTSTASLPIDGRTVVRYMEDLVLANKSNFKSFVTNFTAPYGSYIVAVDGVRDTYFTDKTYWEFFVNHQPFGKGVSFYQPQANDIVELRFLQDKSDRPY